MAYERPTWAGAGDGGQQLPQVKPVNIDVGEFVRTRDALTSAYLGLSASLDRAVKAYLDHTQVVLNGDASLNVSHLMQPFNVLTNHAQMAQLALQQQGGVPLMMPNGAKVESEEPNGKKKRSKRPYKPRDPNAPKRPLTAYFRYLGENRHAIQQEINNNPDLYQTPGKPGDISRIATERWNNLTMDEQEPYRKAYREALKDYEVEMKEYRAKNGINVDDSTIQDETHIEEEPKEGDTPTKAAAEQDKASDDSSSSDDDSEDEEEEPAPPPPPPQKTPKSALKKTKGQPAAQAAPTFSSINPQDVPPNPAPSSSPSKKRKSGSEEAGSRKKRSTKSDEKVTSASPPAPAAPMASSPEVTTTDAASKKKKKDKKRK